MDQLFKDNLQRLKADLEDAYEEYKGGRNQALRGMIFNALSKANWLLREIEIQEGEALLARTQTRDSLG